MELSTLSFIAQKSISPSRPPLTRTCCPCCQPRLAGTTARSKYLEFQCTLESLFSTIHSVELSELAQPGKPSCTSCLGRCAGCQNIFWSGKKIPTIFYAENLKAIHSGWQEGEAQPYTCSGYGTTPALKPWDEGSQISGCAIWVLPKY